MSACSCRRCSRPAAVWPAAASRTAVVVPENGTWRGRRGRLRRLLDFERSLHQGRGRTRMRERAGPGRRLNARLQKTAPPSFYIDRHLVHEVTSPQAFEGLRLAGRKVWRTSSIVATADHNTPTTGWTAGLRRHRRPISKLQVTTLDANIQTASARRRTFRSWTSARASCTSSAPEQGATLPGMTVVCGDSHTSTHGAFGRWRTASAPARSST